MKDNVHDFDSYLARSQRQANDPMWEEIYHSFFPTLMSIGTINHVEGQRKGADRVLTLNDGTTLRIEEKADNYDTGNFFIEYWSDVERKTPGWIAKPLWCDYIAYAFLTRRQCHMLPYHALRMAYKANGARWLREYGSRDIRNTRWITRGVPVPVNIVLQAMARVSVIEWTGEPQPGDMAVGDDE